MTTQQQSATREGGQESTSTPEAPVLPVRVEAAGEEFIVDVGSDLPPAVSGEHAVVDYSTSPSRLRCTHCGYSEPLATPLPLDVLVFWTKNFEERHRFCPKPAAEGRS